jgi:6-phosphogluconolactonase
MRIRIILVSLFMAMQMTNPMMAADTTVWIGMGEPTRGERQGIYRATLNDKGALTPPVLAAEIGVPEFLAIHPNGKRLYAACKLEDGQPGVAAFEIADDKQTLRLLNSQPINDGRACHLATDRSGQCLFTAQYGTGTVAAFPLAAEGKIGPRSDLARHKGSGPNKARQEAPHAHWAGVDPNNRFLFVPDLGIDQVVIYEMDLGTGKLKPRGHGSCPPGSGPRHMVFHPNGRFAYVVNELDISVTVFDYDAEEGTLTPIETVASLPEELRDRQSSAAEICIHPSGEFLYASSRGHDSVSAFRVDANSGRLTLVEREPIRGAHPRSVNLDPSGKWLLVAGRDSNTISVFGIDPKTGGLIFSGNVVNSPAPICVEFQR